MRYSITLCYDGSSFFGWQTQPGVPTVQGTLEDALGKLLRAPVSVTGAGRTDTAVNAIGYIAHFDAPEGLDTEALGYKLNAILPPSIVVLKLSEAPAEFHSRFDATNRKYTYFLHRRKDPFAGHYSYQCTYSLDLDAMEKAAGMLLGTHDFHMHRDRGRMAFLRPGTLLGNGLPRRPGGFSVFQDLRRQVPAEYGPRSCGLPH